MAISHNIIQVAERAMVGEIKLPVFQRRFKWTQKQVMLLYDSIRLGYPLGSVILLQKGSLVTLHEKIIRGSNEEAEKAETEYLVLDGQQRITAVIDLFYGKNGTASCYFLDLKKLEKYFEDNCTDLDNEDDVKKAFHNLEPDDAYIVATPYTKHKETALLNKHRLSIPLLRPDNSKQFQVYIDEYLNAHSDKRQFINSVIRPFFILSSLEPIPTIHIDKKFKIDAISRIFQTLNTTGTMLTSFELVVAVLYPEDINLIDEVATAKEQYVYYPNADKDGEMALQTVALLSNHPPHKSKLPQTISHSNWTSLGSQSFQSLDDVGKYLTEHLGMALDRGREYVPYPVMLPCLAEVFYNFKYNELKIDEQNKFKKKINKWIVGASLNQFYTQGSQSSISTNGKDIVKWLKDDNAEPPWVQEFIIPSLLKIEPSKTIGKLIQCINNCKELRDPLTNETINLNQSNSELHHIFPTKHVDKIQGWDKDLNKSNLILNTMRLHKDTNKKFSHDEPSIGISEILENNPKKNGVELLADQFIDEECIKILKKPKKSISDYNDFLSIRNNLYRKELARKYDLPLPHSDNAISDDDPDA
jgi:hypothetical protein